MEKGETEEKKKGVKGGCVMMNNEYRGRSRKGQSKKRNISKEQSGGQKNQMEGELGGWGG